MAKKAKKSRRKIPVGVRWKVRRKAKKLRVSTELSQPMWGRSPKQAMRDAEVGKDKNRIWALEQQIAKLSTGNRGVPITIHTSMQVIAVLEGLAASGFWGSTVEEVAEEMLRDRVRQEDLDAGSGYR